MKKLISFALVLVMLLGLSTAAFAEEDDNNTAFDPKFVDPIVKTLYDTDMTPEQNGFTRALFSLSLFLNVYIEAEEVEESFQASELKGAVVGCSQLEDNEDVKFYALYMISDTSEKSLLIMYSPLVMYSLDSTATYTVSDVVVPMSYMEKEFFNSFDDYWIIEEDDLVDAAKFLNEVLKGVNK